MATRTRKHDRVAFCGDMARSYANLLQAYKFGAEICIVALVSRLHPFSFFLMKNRIPDG
ncbi:MAG: hypothetical protein VXX79_04335 [Pseudomonadota bacterium]|nr:hypothetical protein [Pseudomonadota bacterium]